LADVSEFRGVRYNPDKVHSLAEVICPPYDVISPQEQQALYDRNPNNMVLLEYGVEMEGDTERNNRYTRARDTFNQWLKEQVLIQDNVPNYYVHEHSFEVGESKKKRLELYACVKLEPWDRKVIFPHEFTMAKAKADRLELMKACSANFSPVFGLYEDPGGRIKELIVTRVKATPTYSFMSGDSHRFWAVNEPEFVQRVSHFLITKPIYIADGHHRYETALAYRDYRRQINPHGTGNESFNYVMMALVSFSDPGVVILPIHRLVRGIPEENLQKLRQELPKYFEVVEASGDNVSISDDRLGTIKICGLQSGQVLGLTLLPGTKVNDFLTQKRSEAYGKLDVSVVQHIICEKILGLPAGDTDCLAYTPSGEAACRMVDSGQFQFTILLNPIPARTIKTIADANDRMPRKSTFFYPKLPTGLVINRLDGEL
jgi:uncharacterized protein (DUF1015 family)